MSTCPTIKVVSPESPGGFMIINASDRKPHHQIWTGDDERPPSKLEELTVTVGDRVKVTAGDKPLPQTTVAVHKEALSAEQSAAPASPALNLNPPAARKSR